MKPRFDLSNTIFHFRTENLLMQHLKSLSMWMPSEDIRGRKGCRRCRNYTFSEYRKGCSQPFSAATCRTDADLLWRKKHKHHILYKDAFHLLQCILINISGQTLPLAPAERWSQRHVEASHGRLFSGWWTICGFSQEHIGFRELEVHFSSRQWIWNARQFP